MKRKVFSKPIILMFIFVLLLPTFSLADSNDVSSNELKPTFTEASVHDPSVIKVDDTFYVFGSHLAAAKTKDFMNWEQISSDVTADNPLFDNVLEELKEAFDWATKVSLWAPDVAQLEDGRFYMYYNAAEGTSPRSALGVAVADHVEGPYKDLGIFLKSGMWDEISEDGEIYNAHIHPNAIDPHTFFDKEGKLWMVYGSYSGGIFILEMDPETGFPLEGQGYGTKLIGGNHSRIEAPYIQYVPKTGYYYLYTTYGGLDAVGGYNMRVARSKSPDGPYEDAEGNKMVDVKGEEMFDDDAIAPYGVKLMGNYLFERNIGEPGIGIGTGYVSPGHNSVYYDEETGEQLLIFHARFPERGEAHEIRVHQMFMNEDGWPVVAPYRYAKETLSHVEKADVIGDYKFINHGKEITADIKKSITISLNEDGTLSGVDGTWELKDENKAELKIDDQMYKGVFLEQWDPTSESYVMTFTALSKQGVSIWGSQSTLSGKSEDEIVRDVLKELNLGNTDTVIVDLTLPTRGASGTEITWTTSNSSVVTETGKVTRPDGKDPVTATLTATVKNGSVTASKEFEVTVVPKMDAELTAHYAFDDNLSDETEKLADGKVTDENIHEIDKTIDFAEGVSGDAAVFDGESGIKLPDGLIEGESYSVSLWLKPEELTQHTPTFFGARDENNWVSLVPYGPNEGNTMVWSGATTWYDAATGIQINADEWSHVAFTVDYEKIDVFINGERKFTGLGFPDIFTTTDGVFALGVNYWDAPYKGLMDELRVYQGVLSEEDIASEYRDLSPYLKLPPKDSGLVGHYTFDGDLSEATGNLADGKITGDRINNKGGEITYTEGRYGQAAVFDGSSGIRLPNNLITSNKYSVSLWLNPTELTSHTPSFFGAMTEVSWISLLPGGHGIEETMLWSGSDLGTGWYDAITGMMIPAKEWSHLSFTVDDGDINVYIDGELKFTGEGFPNIFTELNSVFGLGVNYWDTPYKGLMDELLVYNDYVLTEDQIVDYYNNGEIPELEEPEKVDTADLQELIDEAKAISNDDEAYTAESYNALQQAIKVAEDALTTIESESELAASIAALQVVIEGLKEVDVEEPEVPVNTTQLQKLIDQAKSRASKDDKYTAESLKQLKAAINEAEKSIKEISTEKELKTAVNTLQKAINSLKKKEKPKDKEEIVVHKPIVSNGKATIDSKDLENLADKGQAVIDLTDAEKSGKVEEVFLTSDQVSELVKRNASLSIRKSDVNLQIPSTHLKDGKDVTIKTQAASKDEFPTVEGLNVVGEIYTFTISQDDQLISNFTGSPVTLSFAVDKSQVENVNNLKIYYFDKEKNSWIEIGGKYKDGFVTVTTDHFSTFALMEKVDSEGPVDKDDEVTPEGDKQDPVVEKDPSDDKDQDKAGEQIPKTATGMYNTILIGFISLVAGLVVLIILKRRKTLHKSN